MIKTMFYGTKKSETHNTELSLKGESDDSIRIAMDDKSIVLDKNTVVRFSKHLRYEISQLKKEGGNQDG